MSDVMLLGVLRMPPELWGKGAIDVAQRHWYYKAAADRIEQDAARIRTPKHYTACDECRSKAELERYEAMRDKVVEKLTATTLPDREGMVLVKILDTEYVIRASDAKKLAKQLRRAADDSVHFWKKKQQKRSHENRTRNK